LVLLLSVEIRLADRRLVDADFWSKLVDSFWQTRMAVPGMEIKQKINKKSFKNERKFKMEIYAAACSFIQFELIEIIEGKIRLGKVR
jgi:hypothetical protein